MSNSSDDYENRTLTLIYLAHVLTCYVSKAKNNLNYSYLHGLFYDDSHSARGENTPLSRYLLTYSKNMSGKFTIFFSDSLLPADKHLTLMFDVDDLILIDIDYALRSKLADLKRELCSNLKDPLIKKKLLPEIIKFLELRTNDAALFNKEVQPHSNHLLSIATDILKYEHEDPSSDLNKKKLSTSLFSRIF